MSSGGTCSHPIVIIFFCGGRWSLYVFSWTEIEVFGIYSNNNNKMAANWECFGNTSRCWPDTIVIVGWSVTCHTIFCRFYGTTHSCASVRWIRLKLLYYKHDALWDQYRRRRKAIHASPAWIHEARDEWLCCRIQTDCTGWCVCVCVCSTSTFNLYVFPLIYIKQLYLLLIL